jgi:hypothetical protein
VGRPLAPEAAAEVAHTVLRNANSPEKGERSVVIGVIFLLVGASTVFVQLQDFVNHIWKIDASPRTRLVTTAGLAKPRRRSWLGTLVLVMAATWAAPAWAGDTSTVLLPEVDTFIRVTDTARVFLLSSLTRNLTQATTDGELGVHLDLTLKPILRRELQEANWERDRYLWVRVGFRVIGNLEGADSAATEYRGILEGTTRVPLFWDLWLVNRARVDLRDVGGDFSARLRPRVSLERAFTLWNHAVVPYVQVEAFYDTRFGDWSRERYQVGIELGLARHWRIEPYYRRQEVSRPSRSHENGIGLVLKYYY